MTRVEDKIDKIEKVVVRMEEHMRGMNGKLVACNEHMMKTCPENRNGIYEKVNKLTNTVSKHSVVFTLVNGLIGAILIAMFVNGHA